MLRRVFLASSPGLERLLERELQSLRVPGSLEAVPGGVVIDGNDESLWRSVLQSRVAETARLRLGSAFHAPDVRSLEGRLKQLPWEECLRFDNVKAPGAPAFEMPQIKVTSDKSRLFHTRLIEERVAEAIEHRQTSQTSASSTASTTAGSAAEAQSSAERASDGGSTASSSTVRAPLMMVHAHLRDDQCQVSVNASGLMHQRGYRTAVGEAPLRETLAAACVLASPLLRRLTVAAHAEEELVLWDPFCGSGVLLLEALGIVLGQAPGSRAKRYPFEQFPSHHGAAYRKVLDSLEPTPHPSLTRLTLLGTDRCDKQLESARRNLHRFERRRWSHQKGASNQVQEEAQETSVDVTGNKALPCRVDFVQGSPAQVVRGLAGKPTMILTNVPYGILSGAGQNQGVARTEAAEACMQLGRVLRRHEADWRGVFCLVADVNTFREQTALEWSSELKFLNGGRWVDLLQWTGRRGGMHGRSGTGGSRRR